ncbi:capsule biosynthesis protein [Bradyrhizobium canariense]|uniref:Capsule polysaccharide biosynthesis protein n=1 Tax=Bradyrhizobium canariense TaxID=255045 RepID=A0A1H1M3E4_9BRAD|nr:capsule biosynthesis protein [Bradyrhizobium canariense]SDR81323.1 Capsule polysaccharide biosynthesis protein [Bradyrhizobium canariense]
MTTSPEIILITTLAEYQTRFWIPVAQRLRDAGREVQLLAFDDRSAEMATEQGVPVVNMYRTGLQGSAPVEDQGAFAARVIDYDLDGTNFLFSHERVTFGIRSTAALRRRFMIYSNAMELVLDQLAARGQRAIVVQELGGFLSVIACFYAAKKRGIRNWFIEPSFFRGRLYYTPDSFTAPDTMGIPADAISADVRNYLDQTLKQRAIVIPQKDRHQYSAAFNKIANARNARRLVEKLWDQFALGKHQEFGHNLRHARAHAAMAVGATRLRKLYRPMPETPFVYYPLHVPADMALTLRSPEYLDQVATIDFLLRTIPDTHALVVKEHPAQIGAIPAGRLFELARRFDNFILLPPQTNNYAVLGRADAVVSVNSKSGAEAVLLGKPVIVMGDAFYRSCPLVFAVDRLRDVPQRLREALHSQGFDPAKAAPYFETAWRKSFPGELYIDHPQQLDTFAASLVSAIAEPPAAS